MTRPTLGCPTLRSRLPDRFAVALLLHLPAQILLGVPLCLPARLAVAATTMRCALLAVPRLPLSLRRTGLVPHQLLRRTITTTRAPTAKTLVTQSAWRATSRTLRLQVRAGLPALRASVEKEEEEEAAVGDAGEHLCVGLYPYG